MDVIFRGESDEAGIPTQNGGREPESATRYRKTPRGARNLALAVPALGTGLFALFELG